MTRQPFQLLPDPRIVLQDALDWELFKIEEEERRERAEEEKLIRAAIF